MANQISLGSVSTGTLRDEDLIPSFLWELEHNTGKAGRQAYRRILAGNTDLLTKDGELIPEEECTGPAANDYQETVGSLLYETLMSALDALAPPFCYFGATEGDGADFGFWLSQDSLDEAIHDGEVWQAGSCQCVARGLRRDFALSDHAPKCPDLRMPKTARYRLVVSDHGNQTLYYRNGREVWGIV